MNKQFDILIIDDEQIVIDAVTKICSAEGYKVDSSMDAGDALSKIKKNTYMLFICDIMMPDIDGFQFLDEVTKGNIISPVIMTTGYSTVENAVKSLFKGAIDFIPKPFTADELLTSVARGFKYIDIQKSLSINSNENNNSSIIYVPCPAKYYRLGYSSWASLEHTGSILIGVTDLFLKVIETIIEIDYLKIDDEIIQGNSCLQIKTKNRLIHSVLSPVSGRIIEKNEKLLTNTSLVEKDPYFSGWLYRVIPSDSEYELKQLTPCSSDRL